MDRSRSSRRRLVLLLAALGWGLGSGSLAAQGVVAAPGGQRSIHVTGTGEVEVTPDEAQLLFAVETFAATAREAGQENARIMERVIAALVEAGVPRDAIETRNYSVFPEYLHDERPPTGPARIRGYRVMNQVSLKTPQLDRIGALIDAALAAGANRVDGLHFGLRDPMAAQTAALQAAVERASASAAAIARALGVRLGPVLHASTATHMPPPMPMMARMEAADMAVQRTPIQPGQQTVQAQVTVTFGMEGS